MRYWHAGREREFSRFVAEEEVRVESWCVVMKEMWGLGNKKSIDHSISGDGDVGGLLAIRVWHHWNAVDVLLRLNLVRISSETSYHLSDAVLELTVLGGVDERVDAAASERHQIAEVVEPVNIVNLVTQQIRKCTWVYWSFWRLEDWRNWCGRG